jgi:single-stranded-DNA-specific exonuclease
MQMLQEADDLLLRYGGHAQAGGLTVDVQHLDEMVARFQAYCGRMVQPDLLEKSIEVDTQVYAHEREDKVLHRLKEFGPYGEGNPEPLLLLEDVQVVHIEKVGKT